MRCKILNCIMLNLAHEELSFTLSKALSQTSSSKSSPRSSTQAALIFARVVFLKEDIQLLILEISPLKLKVVLTDHLNQKVMVNMESWGHDAEGSGGLGNNETF